MSSVLVAKLIKSQLFILTDLFSSHTSSSFSPSLSDNGLNNGTDNKTTMQNDSTELHGGLVGDTSVRLSEDQLSKTLQKPIDQTQESGLLEKNHRKISDGVLNNNNNNNGKNVNMNKIEKIKISSDGSYNCQFCEKSFPRLGYLKKHEQVGDFYLSLKFIHNYHTFIQLIDDNAYNNYRSICLTGIFFTN